jgi:hypothetical protein
MATFGRTKLFHLEITRKVMEVTVFETDYLPVQLKKK